MTEKHNEATRNRPDGDRVIDDNFIVTDVTRYIQQLKEENAWQKNDRNAITLFKSDYVTIVLTALHKSAQIIKENAADVMCVQVLEGQLYFHAEEKSEQLNTGQMAMLHKGQYYSIDAESEAVFLLFLYGCK